MATPDEWIPHAEKEFGRFTHALSKTLPAHLTQLRRTGAQLKALTTTTKQRPKG